MSINLYHSGSLGDVAHRHTLMKLIDYRLLSFHPQYLQAARNYLKQVEAIRDTKDITLLFDSGAFTAWKRKEPDIPVADLARTLRNAFKYCEGKYKNAYAITLDKIPGVPGITPSHEEVIEAIRVSDENHHVLRSEFGDRVLSVYHQGEPEDRLYEVVEMNPTYICVSPRNDVHESMRNAWAQRVHKLIPGVRTHGLATTGGQMLLNNPWYSVDSAAIIQVAAFGKIFVYIDGTLAIVAVSKQSPNRRHLGKHIDTMTYKVRNTVQGYLDALNIGWEDLATNGGAREIVNALVLRRAADREHQPIPVQQTLFAL